MATDCPQEVQDGDNTMSEGRLETTIRMKIGEVKGIPAGAGGKLHDLYVAVLLDQEEVYRTATIEKTLNPLIGEEFTFPVPRHFSRLAFYVCDGEGVTRDPRLGHTIFKRDHLSLMHEFASEQWFPVYPIKPDSEVQGRLHVSVSVTEQLDGINTILQLHVRISEAENLAPWSGNGSFSDPYCTVTLLSTQGVQRSEIRKGLVKKRTINPVFNEMYLFKLARYEDLEDTVVRISLWHQQILGEDIFLGQVHLSLSSLDPVQSRSHEAWYSLCPRKDESSDDKIGSIRLLLSYQEDYILPLSTYQPFLNLLLKSMTIPDFNDSAMSILQEVCKDRSALGRSIVKIFLKLGKYEELAARLIQVEVESTSDPNTLFRGNSVASKVIDEFMKVIGHSYLHRTLQPCIDEIFELKRSCEIDQTKLNETENLDVNMTNLLFFVEKLMSAITSSARSCPPLMVKIFSMLRMAAIKQFPDIHDEVGYTAISGFIFLRFFAPAILNPKLFGLRPENPNPVVARSLLLISKTIQNLGNIGSRQRGSSLRKEDYMVPLLTQLMDPQHIKAVKNYLDAVATEETNGLESSLQLCTVYREGYLVKRALARKKLSVKNFKKRYFVLSHLGLSYSKSRGDAIINTIPINEMQAVERVDETAFNMKFMLQLVQPERVLYLQAKNSVDQLEWLSVLSNVCYGGRLNSSVVHSGAFVSNAWSCCGSLIVEQPGCKPVSQAVRLLADYQETNIERELNKLYRLLLESQDRVIALKDDASKMTRSNIENEGTSPPLPPRLSTICELIVFIKNLELSSKCYLLNRAVRRGSRETPFVCDSSEAYVVR